MDNSIWYKSVNTRLDSDLLNHNPQTYQIILRTFLDGYCLTFLERLVIKLYNNLIDNSRIPIWWCCSRIQNNICRTIFPKTISSRIGNDLNSETIGSFRFLGGGHFPNFIKSRPNMTNATLREVWPWHLR